jgi:MFS family permease
MEEGKTPDLRAWAALASLSLLFFLITAGSFTALGVALPDMVGALGWRWSEAGLGYTLLATACGLASLAPALIVRRFGVRTTLAAGGVLFALGDLLISRTGLVQPYLLGACLVGAGFALTAIIPGAYVLARSFNHRSMAIGVYYMAGSLGGVAGPALYRLSRFAGLDWRGYWLAFGLVVLAASLIAALTVQKGLGAAETEARKDGEALEGASVRQALISPHFWAVACAYTAYLLCETSLNGLLAAHMTDRGASPAFASGLISLQALVNTLARAGGGWLGERISTRSLTLGSLGLVTLGIGALGLTSGPVALTLAVTLVGAGYGASSLASTVLLLDWFGRRRNLELMSVMCLFSTLAAAGPYVGGMIRDAHGAFTPAFLIFALVSAAAFVFLVLVGEPRRAARI